MKTTTSSSSGMTTINLDEWNLDEEYYLDLSNMSTTTFTMDTLNVADHDTGLYVAGNSGIQLDSGADIKIGDKSILDTLDKIQERLAILEPNPELEQEWNQLKQLGDQYRELEKQLIEKQKAWETLKK